LTLRFEGDSAPAENRPRQRAPEQNNYYYLWSVAAVFGDFSTAIDSSALLLIYHIPSLAVETLKIFNNIV